MSSICKSFESNAWRNDLCSHCFQSKEEHDLLLSQPMTSSGNPAAAAAAAAKDVASSALASSSSSSGLGSRYQSVLNHCRSSYRTGSTTTAISSSSSSNSLTSSSSVAAVTAPASSAMNPSTRLPSRVKAILKTNGTNNPTTTTTGSSSKHSKSVNFPDGDQDAHEEVIGYGGQECFEDDDETDVETDRRGGSSDDDDDDDLPFTDEERLVCNKLCCLMAFWCNFLMTTAYSVHVLR